MILKVNANDDRKYHKMNMIRLVISSSFCYIGLMGFAPWTCGIMALPSARRRKAPNCRARSSSIKLRMVIQLQPLKLVMVSSGGVENGVSDVAQCARESLWLQSKNVGRANDV
jgi:hypothetical protein